MNESNHNIVMLPTSKLYHHPKNPRDDYKDVDELADSIRIMGVLQNLTVVPYSEVDHADANVSDPTDAYIVIIGNRRLEGAWKAQVETVPCVISDMDYKAQVMTMAAENMLRTDLTPYAQAQHFQLMLDLGESVESVAQKTGFSTTTVRTRIKLLDLDPKKFAKAESRGASMTEYLKLNQLTNPELKNKVLDSIGTANFKNELEKAMTEEKKQKYFEDAKIEVAAFATKIDSKDEVENITYHCCYGTWNMRPVEKPADSDTVKYYYVVSNKDINLYRECVKTDEDLAREAENARRAAEAKREELEVKELVKRLFDLRADFIYSVTSSKAKKNFPLIAAFLAKAILRRDEDAGYYYSQQRKADIPTLSSLLEVSYDEQKKELDEDALAEELRTNSEYAMLCFAYSMWDKENQSYIHRQWDYEAKKWRNEYQANDSLDEIYSFLEALGYVMSDEEKMLQNGNHPIFDPMPEEEPPASSDTPEEQS